jgi:hypothetical protein
MPKCKLKNGKIYDFTNEAYENVLGQGIYIEKVQDHIIKGGKSEKTANKTWVIISPNSRKNCCNTACAIGSNWRTNPDLFDDIEKQKYADKSKYAIKKDRLTKIRKTIKELQLKINTAAETLNLYLIGEISEWDLRRNL